MSLGTMSLRTKVGKGLAGLVVVGSLGLMGCGSIIQAMGEENAAHVRGKYEVEAARIRAGGNGIGNNSLYNNGLQNIVQNDFNGDGDIDAVDFFLEGMAIARVRELGIPFEVARRQVVAESKGLNEVKKAKAPNNKIYIVSEEITIKDLKGIRTYKRSEIYDRDKDGKITMEDLAPYIDKNGMIIKGTVVVGS